MNLVLDNSEDMRWLHAGNRAAARKIDINRKQLPAGQPGQAWSANME